MIKQEFYSYGWDDVRDKYGDFNLEFEQSVYCVILQKQIKKEKFKEYCKQLISRNIRPQLLDIIKDTNSLI